MVVFIGMHRTVTLVPLSRWSLAPGRGWLDNAALWREAIAKKKDPSLAIAVLTALEIFKKGQLDVELAEHSRLRVVRGLRI